MNISTRIIILCMCSITLPLSAAEQKSRRFNTWFTTRMHEETITKEYALERPGTISVTNPYGAITIKAEWAQKTIALSATKSSASAEFLPMIRIIEKRSVNGDIALTVVSEQQEKKPVVNLVLVVPSKIELKLTTTTGAITTEHIQGAIWATTTKGHITLNQACGNIKATTERGSIYAYDTTASVLACTKKGSIQLTCKKLPATSKLNANTTAGTIHITLPEEINADLMAKTECGAVTCDHFVTIKPFTTQWNKNAWRHLKHEICGTLGTGEANITIQNRRGNIKISKQA